MISRYSLLRNYSQTGWQNASEGRPMMLCYLVLQRWLEIVCSIDYRYHALCTTVDFFKLHNVISWVGFGDVILREVDSSVWVGILSSSINGDNLAPLFSKVFYITSTEFGSYVSLAIRFFTSSLDIISLFLIPWFSTLCQARC